MLSNHFSGLFSRLYPLKKQICHSRASDTTSIGWCHLQINYCSPFEKAFRGTMSTSWGKGMQIFQRMALGFYCVFEAHFFTLEWHTAAAGHSRCRLFLTGFLDWGIEQQIVPAMRQFCEQGILQATAERTKRNANAKRREIQLEVGHQVLLIPDIVN